MRSPGILAALAALGVTGAPLAASAYLRTAVSQTPNSASTCEGGLVNLYWTARNHQWWLFQKPSSPSTIAGLDWNTLATTMQAASRAWEGTQCSDTAFQYMGATSQYAIGYDPNSSSNQNIEVFRENACSNTSIVPANDPCLSNDTCGDTYNCWQHVDDIIALTTMTFDTGTGEVFDADTEFNAALNPATNQPYYHFTDLPGLACGTPATEGCVPACANPTDPTETGCVATDVQNTATHEFGHFIGLAHPPDMAATMYAYAPPGQTSKRVLNQDDINGLCDIYPIGSQTNWCIPPATSSSSQPSHCSALGSDAFGVLALALGLWRRRLQRDNVIRPKSLRWNVRGARS